MRLFVDYVKNIACGSVKEEVTQVKEVNDGANQVPLEDKGVPLELDYLLQALAPEDLDLIALGAGGCEVNIVMTHLDLFLFGPWVLVVVEMLPDHRQDVDLVFNLEQLVILTA